MNLEKLLKPLKYADEQILRYYSKLTKKWEDKGHSRYILAHAFNLTATGSFHINDLFGKNIFNHPNWGWFFGADLVLNIFEPFHKKNVTDGTITEDPNPVSRFYKKGLNLLRMPFFVMGTGLIGKGIYDVFDYVKTGNNDSLNSAFFDLSTGYSFFGLSSSIYIKDSDPKLLDKEPFWKTTYNKIKEGIDNLAPQPEPIPAPALSLKNYLLPNRLSKNF